MNVNNEDKNKMTQFTTDITVNPPLTQQELASAFLTPAQYNSCVHTASTLNFFGKHIGFGRGETGLIERLVQCIKPEYLNGKDIVIEQHEYFWWFEACKMICRQLGLIQIGIIGSKKRITGLWFTAINSKEEQRKKLVEIERTLKQKFPTHHFFWTNCHQSQSCDINEFV